MSDVFSSPDGQRLLAAVPAEVSALASMFGTVAQQARSARTGLQGAQHDATWTGQAADAFRRQLAKLPGDLANVERSYQDVGDALHAYEGELAPIRSQFQQLASQYQGLQSSLSSAQGNLTTAEGNYKSAAGAPGAKPNSAAVVIAHGALQAASGAVARLQGELSELNDRGVRLLSEFDQARGHAIGAIQRGAGVAPSQSFWASLWHDVSNFVEGVVVNVGKSVLNIVDGHDLIAFIEDPSWKTFGQLISDLAITVSLVAMVAAPFAAPELLGLDSVDGAIGATAELTGEGESMAEGALQGASRLGAVARNVNEYGSTAAKWLTGAGAGTEAAQGKWGAAALDGGLVLAPGLGDTASNWLHVGDGTAEAAQAAAVGARRIQLYEMWGINPETAKTLAFGSNELPEALRGVDLGNTAAVKSAADGLSSSALAKAKLAYRVGEPLAYGVDNLIQDPAKEAVKHKLFPEPAAG